jgi:epoxyqueuosine reductase
MILLEERVKSWAAELGFDDCRIARAGQAAHADAFHRWIADGHHGNMTWLERSPERRCDPRKVLPGCQSVICLAVNYYADDIPHAAPQPGGFRIARYAWHDDYHDLIEDRLRKFAAKLEHLGGVHKAYVDTGPVLERDFASDAGLGWNGKSTMQIHPRLGTWFFLAEILTTLELAPDNPLGDHCGTCTRCITACPTGAITAPHQIDARRCLAYLTIEHHGPIPPEFRHALGDRIYGCDTCLDACPWNRFARQSRELTSHAALPNHARDFLALDDAAFHALFAKSPVKRLKRSRLLRNVCVALGNTGTSDDLPALTRAAADPDPLVSAHATWAVQQILGHISPQGN